MADDLSPLIHIGYAKAASTSIQSVFGDPKTGFAVGRQPREYSAKEVQNMSVISELALAHDFEFSASTVRNEVSDVLSWAGPAGRTPVVSAERFSGHWVTGGYDAKTIADRIFEVWPTAKVLIVFREQRSMLNSVYRQYVRKGGGRTFSQFVDPKGKGHGRGT